MAKNRQSKSLGMAAAAFQSNAVPTIADLQREISTMSAAVNLLINEVSELRREVRALSGKPKRGPSKTKVSKPTSAVVSEGFDAEVS